MLAYRSGLAILATVAMVFAAGCSRPTSAPSAPAQGPISQTSGGLPDACSLLTHAEATAILHRPNSVDRIRQNPTFSSECNYSTARVDPTYAEIDVGVWNHMPGPYPAGGSPCGHAAICYPLQPMSGFMHARGGIITIVVGSEQGNTHAMVQQVQAYILQKI